jgi:hypothetical protein
VTLLGPRKALKEAVFIASEPHNLATNETNIARRSCSALPTYGGNWGSVGPFRTFEQTSHANHTRIAPKADRKLSLAVAKVSGDSMLEGPRLFVPYE